jgi:hypothetical protein
VPHRVLNHDVPCKYCYKSVCPEGHHHCLRLVAPEQIVEAAWAVLAEVGQPRRGSSPGAELGTVGSCEPGLISFARE